MDLNGNKWPAPFSCCSCPKGGEGRGEGLRCSCYSTAGGPLIPPSPLREAVSERPSSLRVPTKTENVKTLSTKTRSVPIAADETPFFICLACRKRSEAIAEFRRTAGRFRLGSGGPPPACCTRVARRKGPSASPMEWWRDHQGRDHDARLFSVSRAAEGVVRVWVYAKALYGRGADGAALVPARGCCVSKLKWMFVRMLRGRHTNFSFLRGASGPPAGWSPAPSGLLGLAGSGIAEATASPAWCGGHMRQTRRVALRSGGARTALPTARRYLALRAPQRLGTGTRMLSLGQAARRTKGRLTSCGRRAPSGFSAPGSSTHRDGAGADRGPRLVANGRAGAPAAQATCEIRCKSVWLSRQHAV